MIDEVFYLIKLHYFPTLFQALTNMKLFKLDKIILFSHLTSSSLANIKASLLCNKAYLDLQDIK